MPRSRSCTDTCQLRNRIWEFSLVQDEPITARTRKKEHKPDSKPFVGLLLTCKQAQRECTAMFYTFNTFRLEYRYVYDDLDVRLDQFMNVFGKNKSFVKRIVVAPEPIRNWRSLQGEILYEDLLTLEEGRGCFETLEFELELMWDSWAEAGQYQCVEPKSHRLVVDVFDMESSRVKVMAEARESIQEVLDDRPELGIRHVLRDLGFEVGGDK